MTIITYIHVILWKFVVIALQVLCVFPKEGNFQTMYKQDIIRTNFSAETREPSGAGGFPGFSDFVLIEGYQMGFTGSVTRLPQIKQAWFKLRLWIWLRKRLCARTVPDFFSKR